MKIWGITGGRRGNDVLVEGIANLLQRDMSADFKLIHADLAAPYKWLAPYRLAERGAKADSNIQPPFPDMIIASGRRAIPHVRYIKRASQGRVFTVFLHRPTIHPKHFDFVWAPKHDRLNGANVMQTLLSPHAMTLDGLHAEAADLKQQLCPHPPKGKIVTVLIGGPSKAYPFKEAELQTLAAHLAKLAEQDHYLLITLSRRSPPHYATLLRQQLPEDSYFLWDGTGANPYRAMLGLAEHIIVTADSINMIGEACLAGVPVQVFGLHGGSAKFARFHKAVQDAGYVRPFTDTLAHWQTKSQNDSPAIARAIMHGFGTKQP